MTLFVLFICVIVGFGLSGWRGGLAGCGIGLITGFIAGWLLFALEVFIVGSMLRLCLRRHWFVMESKDEGSAK
jgi:hypothetical protein